MSKFMLGFTAIVLIYFRDANAQGHYYVWSYPFETEKANEFEIESQTSFHMPSLSERLDSYVQQFELEYGVTDRFQIGVYQVFTRNSPNGGGTASSSKLEVIYKLARRNEFAVDPLIYLEYSRPWELKSPNKAELKLILSKNIGGLNGTINAVGEYEFGGTNEFTPELGLGLSYQFVKSFRLGVESFATFTDEHEPEDEAPIGFNLGPTIALAFPDFWLTAGTAFGISRNSNAANINATIGADL